MFEGLRSLWTIPRLSLGDRLACLQQKPHRLLRRQRASLLQQLGEVVAGEAFHDHERDARLERPDIEHPGDVLVREGRCGSRFAEEAADGAGVLRDGRANELHGHALPQLQMPGSNDDPHTASPEHALDHVLARDDFAGRRNF